MEETGAVSVNTSAMNVIKCYENPRKFNHRIKKQNSHLTLEFSVLQKHSETQKTIVESISAA